MAHRKEHTSAMRDFTDHVSHLNSEDDKLFTQSD